MTIRVERNQNFGTGCNYNVRRAIAIQITNGRERSNNRGTEGCAKSRCSETKRAIASAQNDATDWRIDSVSSWAASAENVHLSVAIEVGGNDPVATEVGDKTVRPRSTR